MNDNLIYLDNNATTQTDVRVVEAMLPYFTSFYANPSSQHFFGKKSKTIIEDSRNLIATLFNILPSEIIFTSGATESINLAIKGVAEAYYNKGKHIITVKTEHSSVIDICKYFEKKGYEIDYLSVDKFGLIDIAELESLIRSDTILVAIMYVNNETGVIQPIKKIAEVCNSKNSLFFTDATQAVGKIPVNIYDLNVDILSFSGHKFYGPKGIGGLFCKKKVKIEAQIHGGGQENYIRSGTLNVPGIVGLAEAFDLATKEMNSNQIKVRTLRDEFENKLLNTHKVKLNGQQTNRLFNVSNLCFTSIDPILFTSELKNIIYSQGSACNSNAIKPSHVLKAMGLKDYEALSSFRFSFGKDNTLKEINIVLDILTKFLTSRTALNKT
jgi:cysteine desulfurase